MASTPTAPAQRPAPDSDAASSGLLERVIRAIDAAYYEWSPATDALRASPTLAGLFGYDPATYTAARHRGAIHPDDQPDYRAAIAACLKGSADRLETTYRIPVAGTGYRWFHDQSVVDRDAAGRVIRMVGTVIDITEAKQREAENRNLIARQAASIEVLKTISASPDNTEPVFELIARRARKLCDAAAVGVIEYDGALMHMRVLDGYDPAATARMRQAYPRPPGPESMGGRTVLAGRIVHIRDLRTDRDLFQPAHDMGSKSLLGVPLLREGRVIGAIVLTRFETGGFDDSQVALVQSFAEQAVIAIASATAFQQLKRRDAENRNLIARQAASIEVLKTISASPDDTQPVFELIARRACELCNAQAVGVIEYDGVLMHMRVLEGHDPAATARMRQAFPRPAGSESLSGRVVLAGGIVHLRDSQADRDLFQPVRDLGAKSAFGVPLLREGRVIGVIVLTRFETGGFDDTQIELVQSFAEQAVIAIASATTLRELRARTTELAARNSEYGERIAQQSATIDVLKAMSASPGDTQPVFDLIVRRARSFFGSSAVGLFTFDGRNMHQTAVAFAAEDAEGHAAYQRQYPRPPGRDLIAGRAILDGKLIHIADVDSDPDVAPIVRGLGGKSIASLPLLMDGRSVGALSINSPRAGGISESQIELAKTFAEQAVIAMRSAETFRELEARTAALAARNNEYGERIEHQSATIDVLKEMSASPGDAQPVFDLIVRRARDRCNAAGVALYEFDGELVHMRSSHGADPAANAVFVALFPMAPTRGSVAGRAVLEKRVIHIRDANADPELLPAVRNLGWKSILSLPLLRDGAAIGSITLAAMEAGGFSDSQIELLKTFAEQAVIAIASAATYRELQARTAELAARNSEYGERIEHQSATIDVLKAMSASPGDTGPVFDLIVRRAQQLCGGALVGLFEFDGELVHRRAAYGGDPARVAANKMTYPMKLTRGTVSGRAILEKRIVHVRNTDTDPEISQAVRDLGTKSVLSVPLLRDGEAVGAISLNGTPAGGYSDSQVELLKTFAEQAVIATASAETFRELEARTAALAARNSEYGERIDQQSATIDVLKAMSASPDDAQPMFDLIVRRAAELCNGLRVVLYEFDGERVHLRTNYRVGEPTTETAAGFARFEAFFPSAPTREIVACRAILDRQIIHIRDTHAEPDLHPAARNPRRSQLAVPLLRDGRAVGAISLAREAGGFSDSQVELMKTFAEQAVIAIGSVATFRELHERTADLQEALEQQTATSEVLQVINASPGDLTPVFDILLDKAMRLCGGAYGGLFTYDGTRFQLQASLGVPVALIEFREANPPVARPGNRIAKLLQTRRSVLTLDLMAEDEYAAGASNTRAMVDLGGARTLLNVPLLKDEAVLGFISVFRREVRAFSGKQIALLESFAAQAVIAMENARLLGELQARTAALSRSVAELQALEEVLRAVNSSLDLDTVLATVISRAVQLSQADEGTIYEYDAAEQVFVPKAAFGMSAERVAALRERRIRLGETHLGRSALLRAPVHVDDVQQDPSLRDASTVLPGIHAVLAVPLLREDKVIGGLVIRRRTEDTFAPTIVTLMQTFAGQCVLAIENARLFQELAVRGEEARRARAAAEATLADLRRAQDRLVQSEKMASLGQLTAGIAHEIKNPLNFINNFSDLSGDLLAELDQALAPEKLELAAGLRAEIDELTSTLKGNLRKITEHGRRADSIVKNMLLHSRAGSGERRPVDLNATAEEALNLAYHGARAQTPGFNITLEKDFDPQAGTAELFPQEFIRVLLNLIGNGFYAAHKRAERNGEPGFEPVLRLATRDFGDRVEIRVRDNGTGIPDAIRERIFDPFFTTKPAGEGTGLGLSLSYDIVVKQHGGQLRVDSRVDSFTEFVITLPRTARPAGKPDGDAP